MVYPERGTDNRSLQVKLIEDYFAKREQDTKE